MPAQLHNRDLTIPRLCRWALGYASRRWLPLAAVVSGLLLQVGLDVLRPWPMVFLIDYVLRGKPMPPALTGFVESLPGAPTPVHLIGWSVLATVLIFLSGWAAGLAAAEGNISPGQRLTYALRGDRSPKP